MKHTNRKNVTQTLTAARRQALTTISQVPPTRRSSDGRIMSKALAITQLCG